MTNNDIKKIQIIAELNDGTHIIALSDNRMLIDVIVSLCQFQRIDDKKIRQVPLEEILAEINMKGGSK